jgi:hypothetical protein
MFITNMTLYRGRTKALFCDAVIFNDANNAHGYGCVKYAYEAFGGVILKHSRIKPVPATPRKQKSPNDMACDRSRVSVVRGWQLNRLSHGRAITNCFVVKSAVTRNRIHFPVRSTQNYHIIA